ncbi:MAG: 2-phosphosulfolactate phosphatase [Thermodesulfobacteriota bacterium]
MVKSNLKIVRKSCAQGAREAKGLAVIIDVFRAFSCEPLFFHLGAEKVILEADPGKARWLKKEHPEFILAGEVDEVPLEDADLGNSPSEILLKGRSCFQGKTVVHRTTAGVTGVASAMDSADEVIPGSFLMARAIAGYILHKGPRVVTLVAMGSRALEKAPEDEACADYLEHLLQGSPYDAIHALHEILFQHTAQKFLRGDKPYLPREDPVLCLQRDLFDFVLYVRREEAGLVITPKAPAEW